MLLQLTGTTWSTVPGSVISDGRFSVHFLAGGRAAIRIGGRTVTAGATSVALSS